MFYHDNSLIISSSPDNEIINLRSQDNGIKRKILKSKHGRSRIVKDTTRNYKSINLTIKSIFVQTDLKVDTKVTNRLLILFGVSIK